MTSLRKRVSSYFRQLSFHNEPREKRTFSQENALINRYLCGQTAEKKAPPVLSGKNPNDLPNFELGNIETGSILNCATGPQGGLTTVKRIEKHLSIQDADIDYIDQPEEIVDVKGSQDEMKIKVAGQTYVVSNLIPKHDKEKRKSLSLTSLNDELMNAATNAINNNDVVVELEQKEENYALSKSKSAGSALDSNKTGKILRLSQRPGTQGNAALPQKWDTKSDHVYGISDSLYDTNQVTKERNGNPIADCFGIIARENSAILGLADGVNWGEKACIAAKSAVHASLHYLNRTVFDDSSLFDFDLKETSPINVETMTDKVSNTNDVFVCLLRAFNSAHNLILENGGMLTTLTVAVVLPLKSTTLTKISASVSCDKYICCVCNLGDSFSYVYSPKYGFREITKGSHDVLSNRDMRDALGALGPVDGINPELNNLTLSVTTLEAGDIVLIASDGLTDNYDPSVCKFTVNQTSYDAPKHKTTNINPHQTHKERNRPPKANRLNASNISRLPSTTTNINCKTGKTTTVTTSTVTATNKQQKEVKTVSTDEIDYSNPLVAQFIQDNAIPQPSASNPKSYRRVVSMVNPKQTSNKENTPLAKSSSTSRVKSGQPPPKMGFLRSKTSIDLSPKQPLIKRNEEGLPYVNPLQKYELTLLLMEDVLLRGRSAPITARVLCESLVRFTFSVTAAKRRSLEDKDLYYDLKNDVRVEVSSREKKQRRKRALEKVQNLPGKLDHVSVVAYNVGNRVALN